MSGVVGVKGMALCVVPDFIPRFSLTSGLYSEPFRADYNRWLLEFFGRKPNPTVPPDGRAVVDRQRGRVYVNIRTYADLVPALVQLDAPPDTFLPGDPC